MQRQSLLLVLPCLVAALAWPSVSSESSGAHPPPPPSPRELRMVEELARWVGGTAADPLPPGATGWIQVALRHPSDGFDVFRDFHAQDASRHLLDGLPYGSFIADAAAETGVDGLLIAAVVEAESAFDPAALSARGAQGLMQLLPDTAVVFGAPDPLDPRLNLRAGARYLRQLLRIYDGDLVLALAAYNAGPGNVDRFGGVPPFRETRSYLEKVLRRYVEHHRAVWRASDAGALVRGGAVAL